MLFVLILITTVCLFLEKKIYNRLLTPFSIIILPYILILLLNNLIAAKFGFIEINTGVQKMLLYAVIAFFTGEFAVAGVYNYISNSDKSVVYRKPGVVKGLFSTEEYSLKKTRNEIFLDNALVYVYFVLFVRIAQVLLLYRKHGIAGLMANDFELMLTRGPVAHLLVSIFPLIFLLLVSWFYNKKKILYLFAFLIFAFLAFIETEKAQIITLILSCFVYFCLFNEKRVISGLFALVSMVVLLFVGNYFVKLTMQDGTDGLNKSYYFYHLWNYIAGGLISSNHVVDNTDMIHTNAVSYLLQCILALPNMVINSVTGSPIGPDVYSGIPYVPGFVRITVKGYENIIPEYGNVVSTISLMYGNGNLVAFLPVVFLWGIISEVIFIYMLRNKSITSIMIFVCYMSFSFLSYFGSYYTLNSFYERLVWCVIISFMFDKFIFKIKR